MSALQKAASLLAVTTPTDREVRVEHVFHASRERVWEAMTDPKLAAQWWGRGHPLVIERMEVKRGGHWCFVGARARQGGISG
jgi:uncharacterized protein YndB with AHSA1/START domain